MLVLQEDQVILIGQSVSFPLAPPSGQMATLAHKTSLIQDKLVMLLFVTT